MSLKNHRRTIVVTSHLSAELCILPLPHVFTTQSGHDVFSGLGNRNLQPETADYNTDTDGYRRCADRDTYRGLLVLIGH